MISNDIVADDLGPGTDNPQRIAALRARLQQQHADNVPFLLLPVRIETRFMRVDRPAVAGAATSLIDQVTGLRSTFDTVAGRSFTTDFTDAKRDKVKAAEADHARFLDLTIATLAASRLQVLSALRGSFGVAGEDPTKLRAAADALATSYAAAAASVAKLRSAHQRAAYGKALADVYQTVVAPIQAEISSATAPKLELLATLRQVAIAEVLANLATLKTNLAGLPARPTTADLTKVRDALYTQLTAVRAQVHGVLSGTRADFDKLHTEWKTVASGVQRFAKLMAAAPVVGPTALAARARVADVMIGRLLPDLAALGGGPARSFEVIGNLRLDRSARAASELDVQMAALGNLLATTKAPASRAGAQARVVVAQATAIAARIVATLRDVAILPRDRYLANVKRWQAAATAFSMWRGQVADLAARGDPASQVLERDSDAAFAALGAAVQSQRTDTWDAYTMAATPGDGVRSKLFAFDTATVTHTVDELWVRIFPDDISVETHEPALTDDEKRDGLAFWAETGAAAGDADLQRAAWRALATRYGSPRAAWIARTLTPPVASPAPSTFDAAAKLVAAVDTLRKRAIERGVPSKVARPESKQLSKVAVAVDAAIVAAKATRAVAPSHRKRLAELFSTLHGQLDGLSASLTRRARFAVAPDADAPARSVRAAASAARTRAAHAAGSEVTGMRERLVELEKIVADIPTVDPHDPKLRPATLAAAATAPTKDGPWTQAPHCASLPQRFVVVLVNASRVVHAVAGDPVGDIKVGLDPDPNAPSEIFALDDDGNMVVGDSIRWMVDFDEAAHKGMAVRVPITAAEAAAGFDEVLILGVREASATNAQTLVQNLVDNHHYTPGGMAFMPIGSPTNNTEAQVAAHSSDDDPDKTFDLERGPALFSSNPVTPLDAADGLRFARALGLDPAVVAHLAQAGGRDASSARVVNEALWPATLGNYLEEFLGSVTSPDTGRRLRRFFRENVSARGFIPAFRVGHQPYGVLTTTALSRFIPDGGDILPPLPAAGASALSEADLQKRFDILLRDFLAAMGADWSRIRAAKVKDVHSPVATDAQRHFMDILGLMPASVGAEYRFALNVGSRHPATSTSQPDMLFGYSQLGPLGFFQHFDSILRRAFGLPAGDLLDKGLVATPFFAFFSLLDTERVYSVRLLDKARSMRGPVAGSTGASYAAGLLARSAAGLVDDARHRHDASHALLYLLLRQALLAQMLNSALNILQIEGIVTPDSRRRAGSSDEFFVRTLTADAYATKWSYVFGALAALDGRFDVTFPSGAGSLYAYLKPAAHTVADYLANRGANTLFDTFAGKARHIAERAELQDHADRVARLAQIPEAQLDALVREHLDLCSHRLDAWQLGLAVGRLATMRTSTPDGVYLGAFGWLENLRPKPDILIAQGLPPALHRDGEPQVYEDPENQGFIHTPSVTHAVTAAVLRSAYLTETSEPDIENAMAVNLSSRRVRLALELLDGVQAGNDLGALLGYRLERELHEAFATEGVSFDAIVFALRHQYPGVSAVDPSTSVPDTARRLVVDGLSVLNAVRHWVEDNVPLAARREKSLFEVLAASAGPTLPLPAQAVDGAHRNGVFRALDSLADALDAVGDLTLSEAVFQIVRGNFPRAAAVVAALAEGKPVPRPQIARTPRSGTAVVHRIVIPLPRIDGHGISSAEVANAATLAANRAAALPPGWSVPMTMTARANVEPGFNFWLGQLLGDPGRIICRFDDPAAGAGTKEVTARQLGLQPLDLLAMLGSGLEDGTAELAARIVYFSLPGGDLHLETAARPPLVLHVDERGPGWSSADRTIAEIEPLLVEVQAMLGKARAATRSDVLVDESAAPPTAGTPQWDAGELGARVTEGQARLRQLGLDLMTTLNGAPPIDNIDTIDAAAWARAHVAIFDDPSIAGRTRALGLLALRAADFGITIALPPLRFDTEDGVVASLRAAVANGFVQVVGRMRAAKAAADSGDLLEAARAIFGKSFLVAPAFAPPELPAMRDQLAGNALLRAAAPFAMDGWLDAVAAVREPVAALRRAWTLGEAFGAEGSSPKPAQLPARDGDAWLGLPFPSDFQPADHKLSIVLLRGDGWSGLDAQVSGILVDQWTEVIPNRSETTGVAFHYDSPDSMPPQSLLLVVPPVIRGNWRWDDLVLALHDTLDLARSRAVEPEHLSGEIYAQLLPAVMGELVPDHLTSDQAEVTGSRVILDFGQNNAS